MKVTVNASISITKTDTVLVFVDETFEYRHLASRLSFLRTAGDERFFRELKSPVYIPSTVNADVIIIPVKQNGDAAAVYRRAAAEPPPRVSERPRHTGRRRSLLSFRRRRASVMRSAPSGSRKG
ncbi:MAG: hypothetical protein ACOCWH_00395 [Spirochaetota bacterium]